MGKGGEEAGARRQPTSDRVNLQGEVPRAWPCWWVDEAASQEARGSEWSGRSP